LSAMPLGIWLSSKYDYVIFGDLFQKEWIHYFMSWGGMLYDITIPFLLLYSRTRIFAFVMVILFHLMTKFLFPIGMFPYIMIIASMVFFYSKIKNRSCGRFLLLSISKNYFVYFLFIFFDSAYYSF
jgi:hypothetical protein